MRYHAAGLEEKVRHADAVVFDVGNVLFRFDTDHIRKKLLSPANSKALGDAMFIADHEWCWGQFDKGLWSDEEVARQIAAYAKLPDAWREVLYAYEHFHEDRVMLPLAYDIALLKEDGKKVYGLTNYGRTGFDRVSARFDFFSLMDGIVVSGREKLWKPEKGIFLCIQERYGLVPEKTLFIDDSAANIATAQGLGWQTWHYTDAL